MRAAPSRPLASPRTAARSSAAMCSSRCRAPRRMGFHSRRRPPPPARRPSSARASAPALPPGAMFVKVDNARRALALIAARIYPRQPQVIAAVTGTSGKTSVAAFTRQIWQSLGYEAASVGTIGVVTPTREVYGSLTTPDPVDLHRTLGGARGRGRHASGDRGVVARPRPAPARWRPGRGRRLHQSRAATISTIIRASKPISTPSSGCSRRWSPTAAAR